MNIRRKYVISISYFNYLFALGGTDKFICEQKEYYNSKGYSYLLLYSTNFLEKKYKLPSTDKWVIMIDDKQLGVFNTTGLLKLLKHLESYSDLQEYIINHLMSIPIDKLSAVIKKDIPVSIYVHDFYTLCPHSGLVNSSGNYCAKKKIDINCQSTECKIKEEYRFTNEFEGFLNNIEKDATMYFPSASCMSLWTNGYPNSRIQKRLFPHYLITKFTEISPEDAIIREPINVAFVGADLLHKGYEKWNEFINKIPRENTKYHFYHFGSCKHKIPNIEYVEIDYKQAGKTLTAQLKKYNIKVVILWSLIPETYSYTYFESFSADCFVVTNTHSGNIADQTRINSNGYICDDVDGMYDLFFGNNAIDNKIKSYFYKERKIPHSYVNNRNEIADFSNDSIYNFSYKKSITETINTLKYRVAERLYKERKLLRYIKHKVSGSH